MKTGYLGLVILLITLVVMVVIFMITNPFLFQSENQNVSDDLNIDTITTPKQIDRTQDLVNEYQQKSIERQTIDIE